MKIKNRTIKLISALLIVAIITPAILLSIPKQANALLGVEDTVEPGPIWEAWLADQSFNESAINIATDITAGTSVGNTGLHIKDIAVEVLKELARTFAKRLLQKMTQATVNWINTGFHGAPLFVENPGSFFQDIAKTEVRTLVTMFGYDPNRYPFGGNFAQNLINSYKSTLANNAAYSLSTAIRDPIYLNNYRTNFNVGGWNAFLTNTQYQQNNYLGFQMLATQEAVNRLNGTVQNAAQKVQTTLNQGLGFLSPKTCPSNPKYNNGINEFQRPSFTAPTNNCTYPSIGPCPEGDQACKDKMAASQKAYQICTLNYEDAFTDAQTKFAETNVCPGGLVSTTPGSVVGNQIMTAMSTSFRKTELGAAVGGSISAILDALLNKFFDSVTGGLTGSGLKSIDNAPTGNCTINGKTTTTTQADCAGTWNSNTGPGSCSTGGTNSIPLPSLKTQSDCVGLGGTWTTGTPVAAPTDICTIVGGGTSITTQTDCIAIGGTWGTPPSLVLGYCTIGNISSKTTKDECTLASGTWSLTAPLGTCTTTADTSGTCSLPDHSTKNQCEAFTGIWTATPPTQKSTTKDECINGTWIINPPTPPAPTGLCSATGTITKLADCSGVWQEIGTCSYTDSDGKQQSAQATKVACDFSYRGTWKSNQ
ncbi:MAG TPA: hypothetical protein VGO21_02400 [Candidatus Paceibacterota bacterium]|nr:hypothetical protein [Candidatus Paceibacterota bacterium]